MRRCISRKRKAVKEIHPQRVLQDVRLSDDVATTAQDTVGCSPEIIPVDPFNDGSMPDNNDPDLFCHYSAHTSPCSSVVSGLRAVHTPPPNTPCFKESLTQPSSVPRCQHPTLTGHAPSPYSLDKISHNPVKTDNNTSLSQQSLTQPSSAASPSPIRAPDHTPHAATQEATRPKIFVVDSPPR